MRAVALFLAAALTACAATRETPRIPSEVLERIEFAGAQSFSRGDLATAIEIDLAELERRSSVRSVIDDAAYTLEQFYVDRGFASARVEYTVQEEDGKLAGARFEIAEGPRARIASVVWRNVARVPRDDLLEAAGWAKLDDVWFAERAVRESLQNVRQLYAARGFVRADVGEPEFAFDESRTRVELTVEVQEDVPYVLARRPELTGGIASIDAGIDFSGLVGELVTPEAPTALRSRIVERYASSGYPDIEAPAPKFEFEVAEGAQVGRVHLSFALEPGPRVVIERIDVRGQRRTRRSKITGELTFEPGDVWDVRKERESFQRLYRTGLFSRVALRLEPPEGERRTLVVEVDEAPSSEFWVEPGYGSYERARLLLGWRERNLFGSGRNLEVEALLADLAQRATTRLIDRHVFDSEYDASVSLFSEHREEPSFTRDELGFGVGLAREFSRTRRITAEYKLRSSDVSDANLTDPDAIAALADVGISSISLSPTFDTRDNVLAPSRGALIKLIFEVASGAIGSELDFLRGGFTLSHFRELSDGLVLAATARAGVIAPIEDTDDIPLQERYFNGGENSVRSFREDELGLEDSAGNPLGGEAFDVVSLELRKRLYGNFEGALFYDGGNVVDHYEDWAQFEDFRHALGIGLRYRLPIGPVRLDFGWNPDSKPHEDEWVAHLSVGMAF